MILKISIKDEKLKQLVLFTDGKHSGLWLRIYVCSWILVSGQIVIWRFVFTIYIGRVDVNRKLETIRNSWELEEILRRSSKNLLNFVQLYFSLWFVYILDDLFLLLTATQGDVMYIYICMFFYRLSQVLSENASSGVLHEELKLFSSWRHFGSHICYLHVGSVLWFLASVLVLRVAAVINECDWKYFS